MATLLGMVDGSMEHSRGITKKDKSFVRKNSWKSTYYVMSDDFDEDLDDIYAVVVPIGYFYNGAVCKDRKAKQTNTVVNPITHQYADLYEVDCDFDSEFDADGGEEGGGEGGEGGEGDNNKPPEEKTPTVNWSSEMEDELLEQDALTGDPVITKAGEPIQVTAPVTIAVLQIKRYELFPFDPNKIFDYGNHTNSIAFWGAPAGTALLLPMEAEQEVVEGVKYANVTYTIKFKLRGNIADADTWKARPLHAGHFYREIAGEPPVIWKDRQGNPGVINLTFFGTKLPDGSPPEFLEFNRFRQVDFNALNLGPF